MEQVEHRLASYTWNLVENFSADFTIVASEFDGVELRTAQFRCRNRFVREEESLSPVTEGIILDEESFRVRCFLLDHRIPCLAFALEEKNHVNVMKNRLLERGLPVGAWLTELKRAVLRGDPDDGPFRVWWRQEGCLREIYVPLGALKEGILRIVPGQKIAYVTDAVCSNTNAGPIMALARGADYLFIEAMFLKADGERAREKFHLTAAQAGLLAREAGAVRVIPFHFSPKYLGREDEVRQELEAALGGRAA
jgi:ribonuclease Z